MQNNDVDDVDDVSRRIAAFERSGDPVVLWPRLAETEHVAASREIERVTRAVLCGERAVVIDGVSPYAFGVAAHTTGMGAVVGRWLEDGRVAASPIAAALFALHLDHGRRRALRIERGMLPAVDALLAADIAVTALKGLHTARAYYDEPGMRRLSDVDLLLPASRVPDAETALAAAGFRPASPAHRPYKRDWIATHVDPRFFSLEVMDVRTKWIVEVHASLDRVFHPGAVAKLDAERHAPNTLSVAGRTLDVLQPAPLLVYLACHASQELDSIRLLRIFELVSVIRAEREAGRLHWADVSALLTRAGAAAFVYPALALAEDLAPGTVDGALLDRARGASTWAARHTVARLAPAGGSFDDRGVLRQLMWTYAPLAIGTRLLRTVWPAAFNRPGDVIPGWRARLRRLRRGVLSLRAPNERSP